MALTFKAPPLEDFAKALKLDKHHIFTTGAGHFKYHMYAGLDVITAQLIPMGSIWGSNVPPSFTCLIQIKYGAIALAMSGKLEGIAFQLVHDRTLITFDKLWANFKEHVSKPIPSKKLSLGDIIELDDSPLLMKGSDVKYPGFSKSPNIKPVALNTIPVALNTTNLYLGEPVKGTDEGSVYFVVAMHPKYNMAMRYIYPNRLSIRVEPIINPIAISYKSLFKATLGLAFCEPNHYSMHLQVPSNIPHAIESVIGSILFRLPDDVAKIPSANNLFKAQELFKNKGDHFKKGIYSGFPNTEGVAVENIKSSHYNATATLTGDNGFSVAVLDTSNDKE